MHRLLTIAADFEFSELREPNFLGTFIGPAEAKETFAAYEASAAWNVPLPKISAVEFYSCKCRLTSTPQLEASQKGI